MHVVRLYGSVARGALRRYATYRIATAAGVFTNTVFGFLICFTYLALWSERPRLGGYDQAQALTYVWIGQAMLAAVCFIGGGAESELQNRIRTGDVAIDLYRPADLQLWWLATDMGRAAFQFAGRGLVPMVVGALAFDLALPADPFTWVFFLLAVWLGILVSFALRYLFCLAAFWLLDPSGTTVVWTLLSTFLSGMLLPLNVFPGALGEVVRTLPWAAMLQVPADVLLGERAGAGLLAGLAFQVGWAAALLAVGRAVQGAATRRVVVQGG